MPTVQVIIKGKVQGVYYRASAKKQARELGIYGEIKNTREGHVEAIVSGNEREIEAFVNWCRQGPAGAIVTHVEVNSLPPGDFKDFRIVH